MLRVVLVQLVLFLIPFALYAAYIWLSKKGDMTDKENWRGAGGGLFIGGVVLVVLGLLAFRFMEGAAPYSRYQPAVIKDGKIIPGYFEREQTQKTE